MYLLMVAIESYVNNASPVCFFTAGGEAAQFSTIVYIYHGPLLQLGAQCASVPYHSTYS